MTAEQLGPMLAGTTPRLLVIVFTVMVLLFVATGFLTRSYNREKRERGERQYNAGQKLAAEGHFQEAAEMYTEALTLRRDEEKYLQALALALVKAGRTKEAETYLQELTDTDPSNGIANLELARINLARDNYDAAMEHYHRAIYGLWPDDPVGNRIKVRFELVGVFKNTGQLRRMESELLRLEQEVPDDPALKDRIGRLFMTAGSYQNAVEIFREVTRLFPDNAEAHTDLGDAEFALGHYLSARTAYRTALRYQPKDARLRRQYALTSEVINLDPMSRGLGSYTRWKRSRDLMERALNGLRYCLPEGPAILPEDFRLELVRCQQILAGKIRQQRNAESVEENISIAEELERYRKLNCGVPAAPDQALSLVLGKLAG